jgi:hypothetical protein
MLPIATRAMPVWALRVLPAELVNSSVMVALSGLL